MFHPRFVRWLTTNTFRFVVVNRLFGPGWHGRATDNSCSGPSIRDPIWKGWRSVSRCRGCYDRNVSRTSNWGLLYVLVGRQSQATRVIRWIWQTINIFILSHMIHDLNCLPLEPLFWSLVVAGSFLVERSVGEVSRDSSILDSAVVKSLSTFNSKSTARVERIRSWIKRLRSWQVWLFDSFLSSLSTFPNLKIFK